MCELLLDCSQLLRVQKWSKTILAATLPYTKLLFSILPELVKITGDVPAVVEGLEVRKCPMRFFNEWRLRKPSCDSMKCGSTSLKQFRPRICSSFSWTTYNGISNRSAQIRIFIF